MCAGSLCAPLYEHRGQTCEKEMFSLGGDSAAGCCSRGLPSKLDKAVEMMDAHTLVPGTGKREHDPSRTISLPSDTAVAGAI